MSVDDSITVLRLDIPFILIGMAAGIASGFALRKSFRRYKYPPRLDIYTRDNNVNITLQKEKHRDLRDTVEHTNLYRLADKGYRYNKDSIMYNEYTLTVDGVKSRDEFRQDCRECDVYTLVTYKNLILPNKERKLFWHEEMK